VVLATLLAPFLSADPVTEVIPNPSYSGVYDLCVISATVNIAAVFITDTSENYC